MLHNKKFLSVFSAFILTFLIVIESKTTLAATKDSQVTVVPIFAEKSTSHPKECQSGDLFFKIGREQLKTGCGIVQCQSDCKCGIFG